MKAKKLEAITAGARPYLADGEEILGAFIAQARGRTLAMQRGTNFIAGEIGGRRAQQQARAAEEAGVRLDGLAAFALTPQRLLVLGLGGMRQEVKELLGSIPVGDVDSLEVKRFGLAQKIVLTVGGNEVKLEATSGAGDDVREVAEALARVRA